MRSAKPADGEIVKPSRLQRISRNQQWRRDFNAETFLATAGLGRKILTLKKDQVAYAQGDPADALFYVQRGS